MSELFEHEKAAMAEYARQEREKRSLTGDWTVPGHPDADDNLDLDADHEPADHNRDLKLTALVGFYNDQGNAAAEHADQFDNTDEHGLHFSRRLEQIIGRVTTEVRKEAWHFVQFDDGKHWAWRHRIDGTKDTQNYTEAALHGAILGVVSSHMLRDRSSQFIYVIEPGSVPKWLQYVDKAGWRSCVGCNGRHFPDVEIVAVRNQWLYELPVCSSCLSRMRQA
ncbi:hypothetical protein [Mycolicibacterium stellerae]|uniref:hypothetical protein n=1 Tax=Mycolicibacterium stellerae TaxID=2358193 RepID=UPI000F0B16A8|nr:hypothetical protein [Mycolicibacterium stellerae]